MSNSQMEKLDQWLAPMCDWQHLGSQTKIGSSLLLDLWLLFGVGSECTEIIGVLRLGSWILWNLVGQSETHKKHCKKKKKQELKKGLFLHPLTIVIILKHQQQPH